MYAKLIYELVRGPDQTIPMSFPKRAWDGVYFWSVEYEATQAKAAPAEADAKPQSNSEDKEPPARVERALPYAMLPGPPLPDPDADGHHIVALQLSALHQSRTKSFVHPFADFDGDETALILPAGFRQQPKGRAHQRLSQKLNMKGARKGHR